MKGAHPVWSQMAVMRPQRQGNMNSCVIFCDPHYVLGLSLLFFQICEEVSFLPANQIILKVKQVSRCKCSSKIRCYIIVFKFCLENERSDQAIIPSVPSIFSRWWAA